MKAESVMWGSDLNGFGKDFLPVSRCSQPCETGAVKKMTEVLLTNKKLKNINLISGPLLCACIKHNL